METWPTSKILQGSGLSLTLNLSKRIFLYLHFLPRGCEGEKEAEDPVLFSWKRNFIKLSIIQL